MAKSAQTTNGPGQIVEPPNITLGLMLGVLGVIMFGGTVPFTRLAVQDLNPWFVTFGRAALAGLLAIIALRLGRVSQPQRSDWLPLGLASVLLVLGFPGFLGLAMVDVPAIHGAIVIAILPIATALAAVPILGERPSPTFWVVSAIGCGLVLLYTLRDSPSGHLQSTDLLLLGAVASASIGYAISGKLSQSLRGWAIICWALVIALPVTIPASLVFAPADWSAIGVPAWAGFAYVTVFSMFLGFFAWNAGLAMGGVARVSQTQLLQTFVSLAIAAAILGEALTWDAFAFAVAVVAIVMLSRKTRIDHAPRPGATARGKT